MSTAPGPADLQRRQAVREQLRQALLPVEGVRPADRATRPISVGALRRGVRQRGPASRTMTLVEVDGVLHWEEGAIIGGPSRGLRRAYRSGAGAPRGDVIERVQVDPLGINEISKHLADLDDRLTPQQGLRRWNGAALTPLGKDERPSATGRILLFVHGTFSNCDSIFQELQATPEGVALLDRAFRHYTQVLTFDHPTVSISPVLNALDLARRFAGSKAEVDVVSHSRGGLVARWWLEMLDHGPPERRRAVLVGAPLAGTSLAAPPHLRGVFSWFSNLNQALAAGASAGSAILPFLTVVAGLLRIGASVSNAVSKLPVIDAGVAMIPGLAAMSRIDNNAELNRLNVEGRRNPKYFVIRSSFEPPPTGWQFWKVFVNVKGRAAAAGASLIFKAPNDLVVDTASMTVVGPDAAVPSAQVYDFGVTDRVYHTNYFRQPETLKFIVKSLAIP